MAEDCEWWSTILMGTHPRIRRFAFFDRLPIR
jgi:hypothetical protein